MSNATCVFLLAAVAAAPEPNIMEALAPVQGGLTFADVLVRGIEAAPEVHRARADQATAQLSADMAWLGWSPRLDLLAAYVRVNEVDQPPFTVAGMVFDSPFPQILDTYLLRARVTVPVTDYLFERMQTYDAKLIGEEVRASLVSAAEQSAAHRAVNSFLNLIAARAAEVVAGQSITVLEGHIVNVDAQIGAGLMVPADRERVKAQLASTRVALEQARGASAVAEAILQRTLQVEPSTRLYHGQTIFEPPKPVPGTDAELLDSALSTREEMAVYRKIITARRKLASGAMAGMMPKLTLAGTLDYMNPKPRVFPQETKFGGAWDVSVNLSWSPNDFTSSYTASFEADREIDKARADLGTMRSTVMIELRSALASRTAAIASIESGRDALTASQASLTDRQQLFSAGEATTVEILDAESDLRRSQLILVNAFIGAHRAYYQLERALGRLIDNGAKK